jgi:superfamily II DNA or RNA helicase
MPLRPYQTQALANIQENLQEGISRQLVVMATGLGKTLVAAHIPELPSIKAQKKRLLFLVHRNELCSQAARQFEKYNPHLRIGIERAEFQAQDADVVVASIQTLGKAKYEGDENDGAWEYGDRIKQFNPDDFSVVVVDECFIPSTLIDGVPIAKSRVGDMVSSFDHESPSVVRRSIKRVFRNITKRLLRLTLSDGSTVVCTPNHPFFEPSTCGYTPAWKLTCGSMVLSATVQPDTEGGNRSGRSLSSNPRAEASGPEEGVVFGILGVESVEILEPGSDGEFERLCPGGIVYNLEVEEHHNYFANGILVHNCHHASADSYKSVFRYFRVLKGEDDADPSKLFIGITATPNRSDNIGLEVLFDKISYNYGIADGITDGWLTRIVAHRIETEHDISQVHTTHGDFNQAELEAAINTPARNELIAREYCKHKPEGPAFFFTVDIRHAHDLSEVLRAHGVKVYPISGHTPESECKRFMRLINEGAIDGLASAGKLIEGIDCPHVMCAAMCVPTKSKLRFQQMAGRVVRPFPAPEDAATHTGWVKPHALILDFCDLSGRHSLVTIASLFGLRAKFDVKGGDVLQQARAIEELEAQNPGLDFREEPDLEAAKAKADRFKTSRHLVDLLKPPECPEELRRLSRFTWIKEVEGSYHLGLMNSNMLSIRENGLGQCDVYRHVKGIRTKLYVAKDLKEAVAMAEKEIPDADRKVMAADAGWRKCSCTEKQVGLLYTLDRKLRREFRNPADLYLFSVNRFNAGDLSFSRGMISARIDSLRAARQ